MARRRAAKGGAGTGGALRARFAAASPGLALAAPTSGFQVVALPMKIRGGSGAPLRIAAIVPARPGC